MLRDPPIPWAQLGYDAHADATTGVVAGDGRDGLCGTAWRSRGVAAVGGLHAADASADDDACGSERVGERRRADVART